ncbi:type II secretion system protein N, partial [Ralstonia pseudosolanacearum]
MPVSIEALPPLRLRLRRRGPDEDERAGLGWRIGAA